jgi:uncharacterized protein YcsI (UPF0317 family)
VPEHGPADRQADGLISEANQYFQMLFGWPWPKRSAAPPWNWACGVTPSNARNW